MRQKLAQLHAGLAMLLKLKRRGEQIALLRMEMDFQRAGVRFAVVRGQDRLWIEEVHLTRTAVLKETNHGTGTGAVMGRFERQRTAGGVIRRGSRRGAVG